MPRLPAVLADSMTRWMGHPATVTGVTELSPGLLRVGFEGEALRGRPWKPGCEIEFRVSERELRHYTPAAYDDEKGRVEVVFQLHGNGPGAAWARRLSEGDRVSVLGPGGRSWLRPGPSHLFAGDATAVGLFEVLISALDAGAQVTGAVEAPPADVDAIRELLPRLTVLPAADEGPGHALHAWLEANVRVAPGAAYLAGHARSVQRLRARLCSAPLGMRRGDVVAKAYWAPGKAGL
ncbi:siderophore-interacting protein [Thermopolyspora sp. NPDC052614]|uniref:siderophore-interacting protein n=1 Tax=Thermopolyspora sp. NPDC052614 TaxID=3155682 RepID=UPI00341976CC